MTNIFEYTDYKAFLEAALKSSTAKRGLQSAMSRHLGCQASYLYQVLKGKAELTEDQAFKTTTFFKFNELERDYFLCLVRFSKATSPELRKFLSSEIEKKSAQYADLKNRVNAPHAPVDDAFWDYYFATTLPSSIHILTSSENYQTVKALAQKLCVSEEEVLNHLNRLEEKKLVRHADKKWQYAHSSIHFANDSKFNQQLQSGRRVQALSTLEKVGATQNTHFSTLFTLDKESHKKLQDLIAKFVENAHGVIHKGGTDEGYILNLDLFEI